MFRREVIQRIRIEEERFGFEPEVTGKIAAIPGCRIYEVGISYFGRTYEEGKKIAAAGISHLRPASKMSPEPPTESSPLDDFASEIAPN